MKLSEIYKIADSLAPKSISDEYCARFGAYDNSGILVDCGEDIQAILCTLDLSFAAIDKAMEMGANLIITHHPSMYGKINHARFDATDLTEQKLVKCLKNGISVISMHLNLDCAKEGIDESLAEGISCASGLDVLKTCAPMHMLETYGQGAAYGRVYNVEETSLSRLVNGIEKEFSSNRVIYYGDEKQKIARVASFCGSGANEEAVIFAKNNGADVIVSADFKHHVITMALELGLAVIVMTHYASENYGFKKYYKKICQQVKIPCEHHTDENLL